MFNWSIPAQIQIPIVGFQWQPHLAQSSKNTNDQASIIIIITRKLLIFHFVHLFSRTSIRSSLWLPPTNSPTWWQTKTTSNIKLIKSKDESNPLTIFFSNPSKS
jgi:hypothetical protein